MAGNTFRKKLHHDHSKMLAPENRMAAHPVMSAKLQRTLNNRITPNSVVGRENLAILDNIVRGGKLKIAFGRKKGGIGDVLMTTPTVKAIKRRYPHSELTYFIDTKYAAGGLVDILKHNPYIDQIIPFEQVRREDYHFFADVTTVGLARERRGLPPVNRIDMFAEYVGLNLVDSVPTYVVTREEKAWAQSIISRWTKGKAMKVVTLHISSVDQRRNWPAKNYQELVTQLTARYKDIFFIVFDQHKACSWGLKNTFDASHFDIRAKGALINASHLFIGPDSGLLHLAGALEKHIVSLFGSTPPEARINHYANAVAVRAKILCSGCFYEACSLGFACMTHIRVADVIKAVEERIYSNKILAMPLDGRIFVKSTTDYPESRLLHNNLCDALSASANIVIDTEESNETITNSDYIVGALDLNKAFARISKRGKVIPYISSGPKEIDPGYVEVLNTYPRILVPSKGAADWLRKNGVSKPISSCPVPIKVGQPIAKTDSTIVFASYVEDPDQAKRISEAFKKVAKRDLDKVLVLATTLSLDDPDIRIKEVHPDSFDWQSVDCFIEGSINPVAMPFSLQAISFGQYCITPKTDLNYIPDGVTSLVTTETDSCLYNINSLVTSLELFCELESLLSTDAIDRIKYLQDNNNYGTVACEILLALKGA